MSELTTLSNKYILSCFCFGYSRYQSNCQIFHYKNVYIAYFYNQSMRFCKVLGDPLGDHNYFHDALETFLKRFPNTHFYGISKNFSLLLKSHSYRISFFGYESHINLDNFDISWSKNAYLKRQLSKTSHLVIKELQLNEFNNLKFDNLNKSWLKKKKSSQFFKFMVRPIKLKYHSHVRCFVALDGKKILGFRLFDPVFKNYKIIGYYASVSRYDVTLKYSISTKILLKAISTFATEGTLILSLGISPFGKILNYKKNMFVSILFYLLYQFSFPFSFKNLARYKAHYPTTSYSRYVAFKGILPIRCLLETYLMMRGFYF